MTNDTSALPGFKPGCFGTVNRPSASSSEVTRRPSRAMQGDQPATAFDGRLLGGGIVGLRGEVARDIGPVQDADFRVRLGNARLVRGLVSPGNGQLGVLPDQFVVLRRGAVVSGDHLGRSKAVRSGLRAVGDADAALHIHRVAGNAQMQASRVRREPEAEALLTLLLHYVPGVLHIHDVGVAQHVFLERGRIPLASPCSTRACGQVAWIPGIRQMHGLRHQLAALPAARSGVRSATRKGERACGHGEGESSCLDLAFDYGTLPLAAGTTVEDPNVAEQITHPDAWEPEQAQSADPKLARSQRRAKSVTDRVRGALMLDDAEDAGTVPLTVTVRGAGTVDNAENVRALKRQLALLEQAEASTPAPLQATLLVRRHIRQGCLCEQATPGGSLSP
ncbi:hypothetical protein [Streptomyces sp. MBT62]|uniref:hypothetical protein n=1 Tax=Streptomyces sp. MBT62 TaxID=2800410 RepID=UPI00190B1EE7|nr:hypothetical protein [Streptomyces sp. MBT62]MBK3562561.1 hypothetical protein [Streptomyces sp. MBT62]